MLSNLFPVKDKNFKVFYHSDCLEHEAFHEHPERPQRLAVILKACEDIDQQCPVSFEQAEPAKLKELGLVHSEDYLRSFESCVFSGKSYFMSADNYICDTSVDAVLAAAGQSIALAKKLMLGESGFALIRPPGHHASKEKAEGFCFVNNVALAVEQIRASQAEAKFLIVDFDVHHGNGTHALYREDPNVFYFSLHGNPDHIYPHSGYEEEQGRGDGTGYISNKPLAAGCSGEEWVRCLKDSLDEISQSFDFDYLLVSAGYDAHREDPYSIMKVDDQSYLEVTSYLHELAKTNCNSKLGFFLEGGYSLEVLARLIPASIELLAHLNQEGS
ncbi:histone deacetylase [Lentisphaera profundi]|uniref:Histone deacetylase n=1 Tax=Lentisphaera profundi TaxID=1658616 RepID=A0ABY7W009_9BACT|nr:histone deacetylase [Lentisphaera profundi]WDE99292.1 histone deacetylase [Lentisphaera profundi]